MIQRIQTLFFAAAAILGTLLFFYPVAIFEHDLLIFELFNWGPSTLASGEVSAQILSQIEPTTTIAGYVLPILSAIVVIMTITALFKYKKIKAQAKFTKATLFSAIILVGALFIFVDRISTELKITAHYDIATWLSIAIIAALVGASYFIGKDIKLLRDADRICY